MDRREKRIGGGKGGGKGKEGEKEGGGKESDMLDGFPRGRWIPLPRHATLRSTYK